MIVSESGIFEPVRVIAGQRQDRFDIRCRQVIDAVETVLVQDSRKVGPCIIH